MSLSSKSILITGCSPGGIGNALARAFHARGLRVFATARKAETIADLAGLGIECLPLTVDDDASVQACYEEVRRRVGERGLDYLFNNAGRSMHTPPSALFPSRLLFSYRSRAQKLTRSVLCADYTVPALEVDMAEVLATFTTNLFSVMHINAVFAPLLLAARGTFVHTGSIAGVQPYVWGSVYNASKAALQSYCNTLRVEMAPFGVKVINVLTGGVKSNIARTERTLKAGSLFAPVQKSYERRQKHSQEVGMETDMFAREVVRKVVGAEGWLWSTTEVWAGAKAGTVWWVDGLDRVWPGGLWGYILSYMFGLGRLKGGARRKVD
ncbi:hypothetical protein MMC18_003353 [Xylographa bjoerkii]|nr:hypothetical protein [Xylographa bjoerkii]